MGMWNKVKDYFNEVEEMNMAIESGKTEELMKERTRRKEREKAMEMQEKELFERLEEQLTELRVENDRLKARLDEMEKE